MAKSVKIISVHYGHNASVAYLQDGEIKFCASEERFNRIKNSTGFPVLTLNHVWEKYGKEIDYYVISQKYSWGYDLLKKIGFKSMAWSKYYDSEKERTPWKIKLMGKIWAKYMIKKMIRDSEKEEKNKKGFEKMQKYFSNLLSVPKEKIIFMHHHTSHAYSPLFFQTSNEKSIVFTLDGEGDGLSATVNIYNKNEMKIISKSSKAFSLGYLYSEVTGFLGMKPSEHEFKVMGLAPYAKEEYSNKLLPFFRKIIWLNKNDEFEASFPMPLLKYHLKENLIYNRFDNIAGALQKFTEEIVIDWISHWIRKTGIKNLALAGGVFMNVKLNQKIAEFSEVNNLTIVPSAADESTVIGCCYFGYEKFCKENCLPFEPKKIENLYLGTEYSDEEIEEYLRKNGYFNKYLIEKPDNLNKKVAELLVQNKIVSRFAGKMEFGARALGNRSILANPSSYETVRIINEMIKNRDFWMPFAATILKEESNQYLINKKNIEAPFMSITFNTTIKAQRELTAAIHPYDKTSRPQILDKKTNPDYYEIISEFKKLTGIGAILNTSFNLHGEPNVESPKDALYTFDQSGLDCMVIGSFLLSKK